MRTVPALLVTSLALLVSGCSGSESQTAGFTGASDRPYHDHSSHDHGAEADSADTQHDGAHASSRLLASSLVGPSDLPVGYVVGAHHEQPSGTPASNPDACAPLAALLATEHAGTHQQEHSAPHGRHPAVTTVLSKSHFGPQIMEKVVDYGTAEGADAALDDLRSTLQGCSRYVHSTSAIGANTYRVQPGPSIVAPGEEVSLRLSSVGPDFDGNATINWDVWSTATGSQVVTIAFRSAPGGDNADLPEAVQAALAKR